MSLCHLKLSLTQRYMRHILGKIIKGVTFGQLVLGLLCCHEPLVSANLGCGTPSPCLQWARPYAGCWGHRGEQDTILALEERSV